jgi:hypothetical protein
MAKWIDARSTKYYLKEIQGYLLVAVLTAYNGEEESYDYSWYFCKELDIDGFVDLFGTNPEKIKEYEIPRDIGVPPNMGIALMFQGVGQTLIDCLSLFPIKIIRGRVRLTDEKMKSVYDKWFTQRFNKYWDTYEVEETPTCFKYKMTVKPEIINNDKTSVAMDQR